MTSSDCRSKIGISDTGGVATLLSSVCWSISLCRLDKETRYWDWDWSIGKDAGQCYWNIIYTNWEITHSLLLNLFTIQTIFGGEKMKDWTLVPHILWDIFRKPCYNKMPPLLPSTNNHNNSIPLILCCYSTTNADHSGNMCNPYVRP